MKFKIKMVPNLGDQQVGRAGIQVMNSLGSAKHDLIILEGEKVDTDIDLASDESIVVKALERPIVYDKDQKAAMPADLTDGDKLEGAPRPTPYNAPNASNAPKTPAPAPLGDKPASGTKEDLHKTTIDTKANEGSHPKR